MPLEPKESIAGYEIGKPVYIVVKDDDILFYTQNESLLHPISDDPKLIGSKVISLGMARTDSMLSINPNLKWEW